MNASEIVLRNSGIAAVSRSLGLSEVKVAVAATVVLMSIAGPGLRMVVPWGHKKLAGVNLALEAESSGCDDLVDCLTEMIAAIQDRLVRSAGSFSPEILGMAVRGPTGKNFGKKGLEAQTDAAIEEVSRLFESGVGSLREAMEGAGRVRTREALRNPKVLVRHREPTTGLVGKVCDCHEHFALVHLPHVPWRGNRIKQLVREILALESGVEAQGTSARNLDTVATGRFLMQLDLDCLRKASAAGMYRRVVLLPSNMMTCAQLDPTAGSGISAGEFSVRFERSVEKLWELRRSGEPYRLDFPNEADQLDFYGKLRAFEKICAEAGPLGEAVRGLPAALLLLFRLLDGTDGICQIRTDLHTKAAIELSGAVLEAHLSAVAELIRPGMEVEIPVLANELSRLLERQEAIEGSRHFSGLTATFSKPRRKLAKITIGIMTDLGIVDCLGDGSYRTGRIRADDVREELVRLVSARVLSDS